MPLLADPFRALANVEPGILYLAIADWRPATVALVLTHLPEPIAVQVAGKLDQDLRTEVLRCLATQQYHRFEVACEELDRVDPAVSHRIRRTLFTFDDISWLSDREMETLIKNVAIKTWALAMTRCNRGITAKISRNLSGHASRRLAEEMRYLRWVAVDEVERAKQQIVSIARQLWQPEPVSIA